ncbi:MAG: hypothetical protein GWP41_07030 [Planctomycetia bacterium]|jgi:hypothetical protein|nr:hypothetical protein [Planctomycetia bacterium]NCF98571.1 hypothetical protein [Planctomycetia bacterium]NCG57208.1 hypothetical protein [Pseudomonadota bacterium]
MVNFMYGQKVNHLILLQGVNMRKLLLSGFLLMIFAFVPSLTTAPPLLAAHDLSLSQTPEFKKRQVAEKKLRVLHVRGNDSGDIPEKLNKYKRYLRRAGAQHWKLLSEKTATLKGTQTQRVSLPGKIGKAIISVDAKKVATVRFVDEKGKSLGTYRSSRFPLVIVNQRLKLDGHPYVFILDQLPKK